MRDTNPINPKGMEDGTGHRMSEQRHQDSGVPGHPPVPDDDVILYAAGELSPERSSEIERVATGDRGTRAAIEALRQLGRLAGRDPSGPTDELLAATQVSIGIALNRQRHRRRIRLIAAVATAAAAAAVALILGRFPQETTPIPAVVDASKPIASQPSPFGLSDEDRHVIRRVVVRMHQERDWQDTLDDEVAQLRQRVNAARSSAYRSDSVPRHYVILRQRLEQLAGDSADIPRSTQPGSSSRAPAHAKEHRHA